MKISETLSAKYYQENTGRVENNLMKDIKIFLRKKKKKSNNNMFANIKKISQKTKKKCECRKKYYKTRKKF